MKSVSNTRKGGVQGSGGGIVQLIHHWDKTECWECLICKEFTHEESRILNQEINQIFDHVCTKFGLIVTKKKVEDGLLLNNC